MEGTSLIRFQDAFTTALQKLAPNVAYQSPMDPVDVLGEGGEGVACWWSDTAEGTGQVNVLVGGGEVWFDESYVTTLKVQALGLDTDDRQLVCDQRANDLLGRAVWLLCLPGQVSITDDEIQTFTYELGGWSKVTGVTAASKRAAAFDLHIACEARLKLGEVTP